MNRDADSKRVPELDGIRGVAILQILLWHCVAGHLDLEKDWSIPVLKVLNLTWTGVDLFFVLSGFLIGGIMLDYRNADNFLRVFYIRRTLRIFPIYYVVLLAFVVVRSVNLPGHYPGLQKLLASGPPILAYATFTQNFFFAHAGDGGPEWLAATWSLAVEEQFYLCLPFLIFMVPRARLGVVLVGLIAIVPLFRMMLYDLPPRPGYADYLLMPARADALLLGVLAAWMIRSQAVRGWLEQNRRWSYLALLVAFLGVAGLHRIRIGYISFAMMAIGYTWIALFYFCVLLIAVTEKRGLVSFVMRWRSLRYLGRISYGVYLLHMVIPALAHGLILKQSPILNTSAAALVSLGSIVTTLLLADVSWRFFESRLVAFGHSFKYAFTDKPAVIEPGPEARNPS